MKEKIKEKLRIALRQKFANYKPESSFMPFHTKLLGKDRMALYSFIQSLNTNFGTSIFEPVAEVLALQNFDVIKRQVEAGNIITKEAQRVIQDIMDSLERADSKPYKDLEIQRILQVAQSGEVSKIKPTKVDLFLQKGKSVYLIDIKTAKPNKGGFKEFKRTLLTWVASFAYNNPELDIHTLIAIPYNPYESKPYERWTMAGMLDLDSELKVANEFWDFLGGDSSYETLLEAFEEVGCEMRDEIDEYFKKFRLSHFGEITMTQSIAPINTAKEFMRLRECVLFQGDVLYRENFKEAFFDLGITSPPYNVGIAYKSNEDSQSYEEYLQFSKKWLENCYFWAKDGARFCLNIPLDKNKGGQQSVGADLTQIAKSVGWKYHSTIVWNEGNISRRTAWGSWLSASAPYVIAPVELILVLYKGEWKKKSKGESDISKEEFMAWTNGLWTFNGESKRRIGHPAPFPRELPKRCIKLFSFVGDVIFDPFCGSGTTLLEADSHKRKGVGLELDREYCALIKKRIIENAGLL